MFCPSHCFPLIQENINGLALKAAGTHVIRVANYFICLWETMSHLPHVRLSNLSPSHSFSLAETLFLKTSMMTDGEFHKTSQDQLMFNTTYQCFQQLTIKIFLVLWDLEISCFSSKFLLQYVWICLCFL